MTEDSAVVKTRVPESQKAEWVEHAEALGMSQSEFVATMVQAGRRGFEVEPLGGSSSGDDPGGRGLEERALDVLADAEGAVAFEDLADALGGDFETRLDETLRESERVAHSGARGGYVLVEP